MSEELNECPKCGGRVEFFEESTAKDFYCFSCGLSFAYFEKTKDASLAEWNRRAPLSTAKELDAVDSFEEAADAFYKATGMLMPGKDIAAGADWSDEAEDERRKLFRVWCAAIEYMKKTALRKAESGEGKA